MSDNEQTPIKQLEENLRLVNTILYKRGRSILAGMAVSSPQFNALLMLKELGPLTMGELCKRLFAACSTITDLADRLERAGLVTRSRDTKDRRVVRIHILPKGEAVVREVISERQRFIEKVWAEFDGTEQDGLLTTLRTLVTRMETLDAQLNPTE